MKTFIRYFYLYVIRPWLTLFIGVQFKNKRNLRGAEQFIIVANHNSHFDALAIMAAIPTAKFKTTRTVVAGDYFGKTKLSSKLVRLFFNGVLINRNREKKEKSPIEELDSYLKNGDSLILFPEGTRGEPGVMKDFKKGIAILLKDNPSIPFVPVYLDGFGRVLPRNQTMIVPLVCKVRFGEALYPKKNDIDSILEEVKDAIMELKMQDERDRNKFESNDPSKMKVLDSKK
jgi:1-acyl-sn-glycerol-3-phosphate acyltransferase